VDQELVQQDPVPQPDPGAVAPPTPPEAPAAASASPEGTPAEPAATVVTAPAASATTAVEGAEAPPAEPEDEGYKPERGALAEWTVTILLLLFGTTMLVQAYVIPTGSMEDTLLVGDHLLVDKLAYAPPGKISKYILPYEQVKRGDIIVFRYPLDLTNTFVKRAIGVPGDRIRIANRVLFLNGHAVNEPYVVHKFSGIDYYKDYFPSDATIGLRKEAQDMLEKNVDKATGELVVPDNCYFAMGDNRDSSDDSRFWGFVPRQNIIGKPLVVYWSFEAPSEQLQDPTFSWDHTKDLALHFFSKTRWKRSFMLVRGYPLN
jgi:signal peptidase I